MHVCTGMCVSLCVCLFGSVLCRAEDYSTLGLYGAAVVLITSQLLKVPLVSLSLCVDMQ